MTIATTDADYWTLSNGIYEDNQLNSGRYFYTKYSVNNPTQDIINNHKWRTVTSINDSNSDLQAAMVVPADEYNAVVYEHKQPSQAIFVSRGTSSSKDWKANLNELAMGQNTNINQSQKGELNPYLYDNNQFAKIENDAHYSEQPGTQFSQYDKFVNQSLQKYQPKEYSFTGHSLGGALATYEAVQHDAPATTFAGADSFRLLNKQQQQNAINGKYNGQITNYRHYGDIVPNVPANSPKGMQTVGSQQFVASGIPNRSFLAYDEAQKGNNVKAAMIGGVNEYVQHTSVSWNSTIFNADGSIKKEPSKYSSFDPESLSDSEKKLAKAYANGEFSGKPAECTPDTMKNIVLTGEAIQISPEETNAVASSLINMVENDIDTTVSQINTNAENDFIDDYHFIKRLADTLAPDLTKDEIDQCLADNDINYQTMVTDPTDSIKSKTEKLTKVGNKLTEIADKTTAASNQFVGTDNQIGGLFQ